MRRHLKQVGKAGALWLAMMFGTVLSGILIHQFPHPGTPDGPLPVFGALALVNGLGAIVVAGIASRLSPTGLRKAAILFLVVFALETALSSIESFYFRQFLGLTPSALVAIDLAGLVRAAVTAASATLLWRGAAGPVEPLSPPVGKLVALVAIYAALYWTAGVLVAWRSEAVRAYYHDGANFHLPALLALQVVRGLIWSGLALLLASNMRGKASAVAARSGVAFAVLMALPLVYPSAIMPWAVREAHLVELILSNAAFGFFAVLLLRRTPSRSASGRFPASVR